MFLRACIVSMHQLNLLSSVERELEAVADYSYEQWGAKRANKTLSEFQKLCSQLAVFPEMGRITRRKNVLQKALPRLPFLVLYRVDSKVSVITIVQIIHTRINR